RLSLELGGKSPNIVFGDANVHNAVTGIVSGIFAACGQSCVAGSRAYVHESVYDKVMSALVDRVSRIRIGDPLLDETEMGPIGTKAQLQTIRRYVSDAVAEGVKLVYGGDSPSGVGKGWYFRPTIFENPGPDTRIMQEEIFGPVLSVVRFRDEEEVVRLANSTKYGLAAGVWTNDVARAHRMVQAVRAGIVWVNTYRAVSPIAAIGGSGYSGYGREGGPEAIDEYTQSKVVWINTSMEEMPDPFVMR
ncbi:MAG: aldehyde dehydrogenase family protein, partial [Alicyclobacillus sp.]|nr:aldehyde dehydrogenase family protein [Alicyclobacillus sp.]